MRMKDSLFVSAKMMGCSAICPLDRVVVTFFHIVTRLGLIPGYRSHSQATRFHISPTSNNPFESSCNEFHMVYPREIYCILFLFRYFLGRFESSTCVGRPRSKVAVAPGAQLERRSHTEASECPVEVIKVKVLSRSLHEAFGSGVISVSFQPPLLGCLPGYLRLAFTWKLVFRLCRVQDWPSCGERHPTRKSQSEGSRTEVVCLKNVERSR